MLSLPNKVADFSARETLLRTQYGITLTRFGAVDGQQAYANEKGAEQQLAESESSDVNGEGVHILTPGEKGYLSSMNRLFQEVLRRNVETAVVYDDDVLFVCDFKAVSDFFTSTSSSSSAAHHDSASTSLCRQAR